MTGGVHSWSDAKVKLSSGKTGLVITGRSYTYISLEKGTEYKPLGKDF